MFEQVTAAIRAAGVSPPHLAKWLQCSANTAREKLNHPEKFTLAELHVIARMTGTPEEKLIKLH